MQVTGLEARPTQEAVLQSKHKGLQGGNWVNPIHELFLAEIALAVSMLCMLTLLWSSRAVEDRNDCGMFVAKRQ